MLVDLGVGPNGLFPRGMITMITLHDYLKEMKSLAAQSCGFADGMLSPLTSYLSPRDEGKTLS